MVTSRVVLINQADFKLVQKWFPVQSSYIPGIGFEAERFKLVSVDVDLERERLGLERSDFVLLAVGELNRNKNHITILKALKRLADPSVKLLLCGVGGERARLEQFVATNDLSSQVRFLGLRNDVHVLMKCANLFVHPSQREGLGVAPLEAMASGLPVVISDKHGMSDYSVDDVTGYVLRDPMDHAALCDVIKRCLNDRVGLREKGLANASRVDPYSLDHVRDKIFEIFEKHGKAS